MTGKKRTPNYFISNQVVVKGAGHKGLGVFAKSALKANTIIERSPAILIPKAETDRVLDTVLHAYAYEAARDQLALGLGYTSLYNHSVQPNAEFFVRGNAIAIRTTKSVQEGEELVMDYGWAEDELEAMTYTPERGTFDPPT